MTVVRSRATAAWYRFVGADAVSGEVLVKARSKVKADWKGARKVVTGRLLRLDGTPLAGRVMTLERRYAGSTRWVPVTTATTSAEGRLAVKQRPRRTAYFRWVYAGSEELLPARSAAVRAGG